MTKKLFILISLLLFSLPAHAADPLEGYWQTQDKDGVVAFYPCEDRFCARFVWLKVDSPENPSLDNKNPDPALRSRPLCGMEFMGGYEKQDHAAYTGGWIYSPRHGAMFSSSLRLKDQQHMVLRGFFLFSLLGQDQIWEKIESPPAFCSAKELEKAQGGLK